MAEEVTHSTMKNTIILLNDFVNACACLLTIFMIIINIFDAVNTCVSVQVQRATEISTEAANIG